MSGKWTVLFHDDFVPEYDRLAQEVRVDLLAQLKVLEQFGPHVGRPAVDTLKGSKVQNLKELRFRSADGVWRFAFAFDPKRRAVVLCGGDKSGIASGQFYRELVRRAEDRFASHLRDME